MQDHNSKKINLVYFIWCFVAGSATFIIYYFIPDIADLYKNKFQVAVFAGFLTLGSFLLTLKTFVIIQFKTQLFEKDPYKKVFESVKTKETYKKGDYYQPLDAIAKLLLLAVISSLGTSFVQITLGFIQNPIIASFCLSMGIATLIIVGFAWFIVRKNTIIMIEYWEDEAAEKISLRDK